MLNTIYSGNVSLFAGTEKKILLDRPFCESDLMFLLFNGERPSTDILETFPHDVALIPKEMLLCRF